MNPGRSITLGATPGFLVVVLAFFMPWYAVSCQGTVLAEATGWDITTHGFRNVESPAGSQSPSASASNPFAGGGGSSAFGASNSATNPFGSRPGPFAAPSTRGAGRDIERRSKSSAWLVVVPVFALVGIALALLGARGAATGKPLRWAAAATGLAVLVVIVAHYLSVKGQMQADMTGGGRTGASGFAGMDEMSRSIAAAIQLELRLGWYLAFLGASAAMICAGIGAIGAGRVGAAQQGSAPAGGYGGA